MNLSDCNIHQETPPLYKYMKADIAEKVLDTQSLRWSSPKNLNDPFDIIRELRFDFSEIELEELIKKRLLDIIEKGPTREYVTSIKSEIISKFMEPMLKLNLNQRKIIAAELKESFFTLGAELDLFEPMKQGWNELVPETRVLSLSIRKDIIPLWDRYADDGKGLVLEFKGAKDLDTVFHMAKPVIYKDEIPSFTFANIWVDLALEISSKSTEDSLRELWYIKKRQWETEQEWRIIIFERNTKLYVDKRFFLEDIRAVYFGYKCSDEYCSRISALLKYKYPNVLRYKVTVNHQKECLDFIKRDGYN